MNYVLSWLLGGDVSIQYQTHRDLLHSETMLLEHLQQRIETEGFGSQLLSIRNTSGHYDLLRFLEFAARADIPWNENIEKAVTWLVNKQLDGVWNLELVHPGKVHVQFEPVKQSSRFITLKALSILNFYASDSKTAAKAWTMFVRETDVGAFT